MIQKCFDPDVSHTYNEQNFKIRAIWKSAARKEYWMIIFIGGAPVSFEAISSFALQKMTTQQLVYDL